VWHGGLEVVCDGPISAFAGPGKRKKTDVIANALGILASFGEEGDGVVVDDLYRMLAPVMAHWAEAYIAFQVSGISRCSRISSPTSCMGTTRESETLSYCAR
jgi:hypothetical protein